MAIFGKKKDKPAAGQEGSPTFDGVSQPPSNNVGSQGRAAAQGLPGQNAQSVNGPMSPQGPPSRGHASKNSYSGPGSAGVGSGFGPNGSNIAQGGGAGILRSPKSSNGMQGPPGAGGYKMPGPPSASMMSPTMRAPENANGSQFSNIPGMPPGAPPQQGPPNGIAGLPPQSNIGPPLLNGSGSGSNLGGSGPPSERPRTQQVVYPWSQRTLTMKPPRFLDEARQTQAGALSPSPFPRYGHASNSMASSNGEVYLFGGLVRESVKNDLYVVNVDRVTQTPGQNPPGAAPGTVSVAGGVDATLVQTSGEIPPPRVGHATVLVANVLILWGGDTKVRADDKQDEGLYLLNLSTREWTRVRPNFDGPNAGPVGRYGHTVSIVGSRFFVFGGQVDGTFMNDLWTFDLNSLKTTPKWEILKPNTELPPRRTGHASVTYKDKIYIFGGTDGQYHYNDTWCYDVATNSWKELSCIGYIPVPREGHATCLVDDVMYIFGGRGVDGKDLGDLASFRISNQRWYMFANMGPSPSGRSGHALTAFQNKVVVLGGESFTGNKPDDPSIIYVLDTGKIKYPPEGASKTSAKKQSDTPNSRAMSPAERAMSPTQRAQPDSLAGALQQRQLPSSQQAPPSDVVQSSTSPDASVPPFSPPQGIAQQPSAPSPSSQSRAGPGMVAGAAGAAGVGAVAAGAAAAYHGPRSQRSLDNMRSAPGAGAMSPTGQSRGVNGASPARAMSPAAQDGFHYAGLPNGTRSVAAPQTAEVEALRKRDAWMKTALALAAKKGYIVPEELEGGDGTRLQKPSDLTLDDVDLGPDGKDKERIVQALVSLKTQLAQAKADIAQQAQSEADRIGESDRARATALSEATFYRAKLDALETGNTKEVDRLQRERTNDVERQLSDSLRETTDLERQLNRLREELKLEQQLRSSAEERLSETSKRAMAAESAQLKAHDELALLQKKTHMQEAQLRDHRDKVVTLTSLTAKHQGDYEEARGQLDDHRAAADRHGVVLRELQASLAAATARASEHERMHMQHRDLVQQHEMTISRLKNELHAKSSEADQHSSRAVELESLVSRHREEADSHRTALSGGLAQMLAFHKQQQTRSVENSVPSHVNERLRTLQEESESLRQTSTESKQAADQAYALVEEMRERNRGLERQQSGLRSELSAMRSQLTIALQEMARLKDMSSTKETELRDSRRQVEASQMKHSLLRQFMTEHGMAVPSDDELGAKNGFAERRLRQLEEEVDSQARQINETEHRLRDASSRVEELTRELEHANSRADRDIGGGSQQQLQDSQRRAALAERELEETHNAYRERTAQLENDYQTAVQFVKGSEKMLRRMKDELTRYKSENGTLQNDLMNARSGMYSPDNAAAKDVEALRLRLAELTQQHDETGAENRELERRMAALIAEHKEFRDKNRDILEAGPSSATNAAKAQELEAQVQTLESSLNDVRRELHETLSLNTHLSNELNSATRANTSTLSTSTSTGSLAKDLSTAQKQNQQLQSERETLAQKLQEAEDKLQLLLGRVEANESDTGDVHEGGDAARDSHAFSITSELDKWERDRAGFPDSLGGTLAPSSQVGAGAA